MPLFTDAMGRAQSVWGSLFPSSPGNYLAQNINQNNSRSGNPVAQIGYLNPSPYRNVGMFSGDSTAKLTAMSVADTRANKFSAVAPSTPKPKVDASSGPYAAPSGGYATPADFYPLIPEAATAQNVDAGLIRAVMESEWAGGDPAKQVSPAGAIGVMQLMPDTAKGMGVDPWDPKANIMGGTAYLAEMIALAKGDIPMAVGKYNAGPYGNLANPETVAYTAKVMGLYEKYKGWKPDTVTNSAINQSVANQLPEQQSFIFAKAQSIMAQRLPYVYGGGRGTAPGLDCSSFVSRVYKEALGVNLIPQSDTSFGQTVAANGPAQVGDLVYFEYRDSTGNRFPHMGMVYTARGGQVNVIHHTTFGGSNTTRVDDLDSLTRSLGATAYIRRLPA